MRKLSLAALKYGALFHGATRPFVASRLYLYNREPLSPQWLQKVPDSTAVEHLLGLNDLGATRRTLEHAWVRSIDPTGHGWLAWSRRLPQPREPKPQRTFKLYVSPVTRHLRDTFESVVAVVAESPCLVMKIGGRASDLLRPDKLMLYFGEHTPMIETADRLLQRLRGCPAQGVPFTADLSETGLMSWAIDPPYGEAGSASAISWRVWVTARLADSIVEGIAASRIRPWEFALTRIALDGIDPESWRPPLDIWDKPRQSQEGSR